MNKDKLKFLKNPWFILFAVMVGIALGLFFKKFALSLDSFGKMYLYFLQMCVIPILITAIISSIGKLIKTKHARDSIKKMIAVFLVTLLTISLFGLIGGLIGKPGHLDQDRQAELGQMINKSEYAPDLEISLSEPPKEEKKTGFSDFCLNMIPNNVFKALTLGRALELVFFSIIFGIALGFIRGPTSDTIVNLTSTLFETFQKLIDWAMYGLAFGLICLLAAQIASIGVGILTLMLKFIVIFYAVGIAIIIVCIFAIAKRSKQKFSKALKAIQQPIIVSLATRSSFASIPSAINALEDNLKFEKVSTNLFVPLGVTIARYGNVLFFALGSIFVAQLYGADLGITDYLMIVVGSVFAGIATTGATGILTLPMIGIVLEPLGLPFETAFIIFVAIDPIIDPIRTLLIVLTNMTSTAYLAEPLQETIPVKQTIQS